jgi:predicted small lipoprotein YifL
LLYWAELEYNASDLGGLETMTIKNIFFAIVVILVMSFLVGCGNAVPTPAPEDAAAPLTSDLQTTAEDPKPDTPIPLKFKREVPRISPEELNERLNNGEAILVVDTRGQSSFEQRHIAGAIEVQTHEIEERLDEFPRDQEIVFYCD